MLEWKVREIQDIVRSKEFDLAAFRLVKSNEYLTGLALKGKRAVYILGIVTG